MDYYYEFCGVRFRVSAEAPIWEDAQSEQFHIPPCVPDVTVELSSAPELPAPEGDFLGRRGEKRVWRSPERITRQTQDMFRSYPHLSVSYAPGRAQEVRAIARGLLALGHARVLPLAGAFAAAAPAAVSLAGVPCLVCRP